MKKIVKKYRWNGTLLNSRVALALAGRLAALASRW
jgi:hypothetical protein